jgi:hypothetical protein
MRGLDLTIGENWRKGRWAEHGRHGNQQAAKLRDVAHLGLNLEEAKQLPVKLRQEIVAAQAKAHAVMRS